MSSKQGGYLGEFKILIDDRGVEDASSKGADAKTSTPAIGTQRSEVDRTSTTASIVPGSTGVEISDDDILKGIRYVETLEGRRSGGKTGGYSEKLDKTGVYGAYQIKKDVWGSTIKQKFGWDFEDWFSESPKDASLIKSRQDKIAKELLLPEHKRQVKAFNLYETPLGKHLPKGSLEILAQLGPGNLKKFLTTGYDATAFDQKQGGQILGYLRDSMKVLGKEIPKSFYDELTNMGGVSTKYAKL